MSGLNDKMRSLLPGSLTARLGALSSRPQWNAAWLQRRAKLWLGWPGMLGMGLAGAALLAYITTVLPTQAALITTEKAIADLRSSQQSAQVTQQTTPESRLAQFYQSLPAETEIPGALEKLFTLAEKHDMTLDQGEYQAVRSKKGRLTRVQVTLPVLASYPQVRSYLAVLQTELPNLALAQINFQRDKVGDGEIEANLKLELYFTEGGR
jgi:Tfp pilus assembly protein PilO